DRARGRPVARQSALGDGRRARLPDAHRRRARGRRCEAQPHGTLPRHEPDLHPRSRPARGVSHHHRGGVLMRVVKKMVRAVLFLLLSLVTLTAVTTIVALLWARSDSGRARIRTIALTEARKTLPGLELGHVGGDFTRTLELDDVRIRDREGREAVRVDRI